MNIAVILAGGVGSRFGADRPKQFVEVLGKPVLAYTVELYQKHPQIDMVEIVCHCQWVEYTKRMVRDYGFSKVRWIVIGGETFQDSVLNGVNHLRKNLITAGGKLLGTDLIFLHYGAAPFTSKRIIDDCIKTTTEKGNAFTATPLYQLLGSNDENRESHSWVDRDKIVQIACPYGFRFNYLISLYDRAEEHGLLEKTEPHTTSLVFALGDILYQSYGDQTNIKITTQEDIELFEGYIRMKQKRDENTL